MQNDISIWLHAPRFTSPIANITTAVGREAILTCLVENIGHFKVAWLRVDTQTILTIQSHVITKNHRIGVTHSEHKTWYLHIKEVKASDKGWYMCQINTDPMKSQVGYLDVVDARRENSVPNSKSRAKSFFSKRDCNCVRGYLITDFGNGNLSLIDLSFNSQKSITIRYLRLPDASNLFGAIQIGLLQVPPDILDYATSTDVVVREGSSVNLHCVAKGFPSPSITWKRETGELIKLPNGKEVVSVEGSVLNLTRVSRQQMGPYLCIASNGVPPSVSKRIMLIVHFPPMVWIKNQLVGAYDGQHITLECHTEAFPKSINYWTNENEDLISQTSDKYKPIQTVHSYQTHMKLRISSVEASDYGNYRCISKNSLGETDGTVQLFEVPKPSKLLNGGSTDFPDQTGSLLQDVNSTSSGRKQNFICTYVLVCVSALIMRQ